MTARRSALVALLAVSVGLTLPLVAAPRASAAPADVVINEMMYHPVSDLDGDDYLELANTGSTAVDLSGWSFSGITLTLPTGTTIPAGGYLVVAKDAVQFQSRYGFAPAAVYGGNLSNGGETIALKDSTGATIDSVSYLDADPWPVKADGTGPSLELVDSSLDNNDYLNWAAATNAAGGTPGAANSVRRTGLPPRIANVTATPTAPAAGQPVTITAAITNQSSATLRYRINFNAEQSLPMTSNGDGTFSATIPGASAGQLIRYRVEATNANGLYRSPRIDDTINYRGVVVPHGITSPIPVLEWFIADADYNAMVNDPTADITKTAAIAYDGQVIDNVEVNIKGHASQLDPKVSWKFHTPQGHDLTMAGLLVDPVDEFDMQADWSDKSHGRSILSWEAYQRAGVVNHQMFPVRTQRNGAFQGLYNLQDTFDGTWRDRNGYSAKLLYSAETSAFNSSRPVNVRFTKENPDDGDYAPLQSFLNGVALTGTAQRDALLASGDLPEMINYAAVTAIVEHVDSSSKNFYLTQDPTTGRWSIIPWDLDHTIGNGCCNVTSNFVTPAEPGDNTSALMRAVLAVPQWRDMYFRRLRTLVDDILAPNRMEALYDARLGPAEPVGTLDFSRWPYTGTPITWATYRKRLFTAIQARRDAFATDSRVPGDQPASPDIVIDEIQHSPTAGNGAEFVELYNPGNQAIDLSGWGISNGITLAIQPGTVILPHAAMTFVSNDPTFRSTYGPTVFVGGRYTGNLASAATLTLTRADGSTADQVAYGGAGWPVPTSGQSLELTNLAGDNNNGANWSLSSGGGTPGVVSGAPAVTAPGAPTIGTATAGDARATVRWSAPADDGGAAVTGYSVKVLDPSNLQVGALRPAGGSATSLVVTGLTNGTAYHFQVAATNSAGTGAFSASSNSVTPAAATVPGPPVIGAPTQGAIGGTLTAIAHWTPPTTDGGSPITGYQVTALRMSSSASDATVLSRTTSSVLGPSVRQHSFTLTAGNYRFEVVAINAVGTSAPSARSANITPR
ncbi:MAG: lamin tail domain-containing protein [Nocardioides sp.]